MATVVIPYLFNTENSYVHSWNDIEVEPAMHHRYFLQIPEGTSDIRFKISSAANKFTHVRYFLFDNDGRQSRSGVFNAGMQEDFYEEYFMHPDPGVYELDIVGYYTDNVNSVYDLTVDLDGIDCKPVGELAPGKNTLQLENKFNEVKKLNIAGELLGYMKCSELEIGSAEPYTHKFKFDNGESVKKFDLKMSKEDFNKLTDMALVIYDSNGIAVKSNALSYSFAHITYWNAQDDDEEYTLKLIPGFANAGSQINVKLTEYTSYKNSTQFKIRKNRITLYPTTPEKLEIEIGNPDKSLPAGAKYWGKCYFNNPGSDKTETEYQLFFNN